MRRFWGKREGFFEGSGFRAEAGNSFWHEKSRFFAFSTKATNATLRFEREQYQSLFGYCRTLAMSTKSTKSTNATPVFERKGLTIYYLLY